MKRLLILALILIGIIPGSVVLAAVTYSADVTVSNNGTISYPQIGVTALENVTLLVSNGFITPSGLDSRVRQSGSDLPYMLATDRVTFAVPSSSGTSNVYQFVTGQTPGTFFQIIPGYGGYVTTNDTAAIELGNNFKVAISGYVVPGTTAYSTNETDIAIKVGAFGTFATQSGNITSYIATVNQTVSDNDLHMSSDAGDYQVVGEDIFSFPITTIKLIGFEMFKHGSPVGPVTIVVRKHSDHSVIGTIGSIDASAMVGDVYKWYEFYANPVINSAVQDVIVSAEYSGGDINNYVDIRRYSSGDIYSGGQLSYFKAAAWTDAPGQDSTFFLSTVLTSTPVISSGSKIITTQSDATNFWVSAGTSVSGNVTTSSVPDNPENIVWGKVNPYLNYIDLYKAGVLTLTYQPETMIIGTTLVDLLSTKNGDITWGSNPSGLTASFGALVSTTVITTNTTSSNYVGNFMPTEVHSNNSPTLGQAEVAVESDILYPFFEPFATASGTQPVWFYWFGTVLIGIVGFILAYRTKHLLISAIAFDIPFGYGIAKGFVPWWVIIILALWTIGAAIQEARM